MNHKTLSEFRVGHGAVLEGLLVDSFAALLKTGVASLDRVAQDGMWVRASAGTRPSLSSGRGEWRRTWRRLPAWRPGRRAAGS